MLPVLRNGSSLSPMAGWPANRIESLFDRFFGDDGGFNFAGPTQAWSWAPIAMWEDDDRVSIEAELPGVSEKDLEITVHNGVLTIQGERKVEEGRRYLYNGRAYGRFQRTITLPDGVGADQVQATLKDGVLHVELPKTPESKPRKIEVKVG
jgi:HSP20 family protein